MKTPGWWSSYGDDQIATGALGVGYYEYKWECNLRNIHAGNAGEKAYFVASLDIRRRLDDALEFEEVIKLNAHDLFARSGDISRFSGMELEIKRYITKHAELIVKQMTEAA